MYHLYPKLLAEHYVNINSRVPDINRGGCGIFAEELYKALELLGNKPEIVILTDNYRYTKAAINNDIGLGGLTHIVVKVGKYFYDSNGKHNSIKDIVAYYDYNPNMSSIKCPLYKLEDWNIDWSLWNGTFNRKYIKTIASTIEDAVKIVKEKTRKKLPNKFGFDK